MKLYLAHILTEQKYELEDLKRRLDKGEDFADLARKYSTCSSAKAGGDLGEIDLRRLDPEFAEAAQVLKSEQLSAITRTKFGYHLIKRLK